MESLILRDPGVVETIECSWWKFTVTRSPRTFYRPDLLPRPRSPRMRISETKIHSKNSLRWQIIKQNDAELSVIFFFSNWDYSHTNHKQKRCKVPTVYIRKLEFRPEKSNGSHRYLLESSENVDFVLIRLCNFLLLSDFSSDFDILCSELFSHHD